MNYLHSNIYNVSLNVSTMERIKGYFEKYGIEKQDVVKGVILLKTSSIAISVVTLGICYRYRPLIRLFNFTLKKRLPEINLQDRLPKITPPKSPFWRKLHMKVDTFIAEKSEKISNSKYFKPIPNAFGLEPKKFAISLAENYIFGKLITPVVLPLQFWSIILLLRNREKEGISHLERIHDSIEMCSKE